MKRLAAFLLTTLLAGAAFAEDAAAPSSSTESSSEPKTTEVKPLEPKDEKKDEHASKSSDKKGDGGVTYSAIGLSRVSSNFDNLEPTISLAGVLGLKIPTIDWVAAEVEFGQSIIPGKNDGRTSSSGTVGGGNGGLGGLLGGGGGSSGSSGGNFTSTTDSLQLLTIGVFGLLKSPPEWFHGFYAKGKVGYGFVQSNIQEISKDSTGTAFAVGGGWQYNARGGVEFAYTKYPASIDAIGITISYGFGGDED